MPVKTTKPSDNSEGLLYLNLTNTFFKSKNESSFTVVIY